MIEKTLTAFIQKVSGSSIEFKESREYEGEFEVENEITIFPPSALAEITGSENEKENYIDEGIKIRLLLITSHIKGISVNATGALKTIDTLKNELHDQKLFDGQNFVGYLHYKGFSLFANLPGLKVYEMFFLVKR